MALSLDSLAAARAGDAGDDVAAALAMTADPELDLAALARGIGAGGTVHYLSVLAGLGYGDLTAARTVEPHVDALSILHQAGLDEFAAPGRTWGVYAAHAPGRHLAATPADAEADPESATAWSLTGTKPWCSLGGRLTHAVVTAHVPNGTRRAFAVALQEYSVRDLGGTWANAGLAHITTSTLAFQEAPARTVGGDDWYLTRPGFAWGGVGVAAIWYGAAVWLRDRLLAAATGQPGGREPDQLAAWHVGRVDAALYAAGATLLQVGRIADGGQSAEQDATADSQAPAMPMAAAAQARSAAPAAPVAPGLADPGYLATTARAVVHDAAELALTAAGHALGPGPLTGDEAYARRVADLTVYLRQHHAERDLARQGNALVAARRTDGGGR